MASPVRTDALLANTGSGQISAGVVVDTTTPEFTTTAGQLTPPLRIEFLSASSYQVVNSTTSAVIEGPIAFTPGNTNTVFPTPGSYDPGYRIDLSGSPAAGDVFTVDYNTGGVGDNRNALLLAGIQNAKILNNGATSLQGNYSALIANVGSKTHQADIGQEAGKVLLAQAQDRRDSISAVNLDEEAANLLRFEQAYQAAAQIVSIARSVFNELMAIFR